jgi:hypothetical protein
MDIIVPRVPFRNLRGFPLFHVRPSFKNCPSSRRVIAVNSVCSDFDVFGRQIITLTCDIVVSIILQVVIVNYLCILIFALLLSCSLSFVICVCAVSVIGHLAFDSAH